MRIVFVSALLIVSAGAPAFADQQQDAASLNRIRTALSTLADSPLVIAPAPPIKSWGGITLVTPDVTAGQFIQVKVPVGELAMKAVRAIGNARYERAERKAHDQVARELQEFQKQQK